MNNRNEHPSRASGNQRSPRENRYSDHSRQGDRPVPRQTHGRRSGSVTGVDWFGLISMGLLMACSIWLTANLMMLRMLPDKYLLLAVLLLFVINAQTLLNQVMNGETPTV
ncbi:MAG: hypothetical protein VB023_07050 [Oscillibacter sp.]|nr:hypothetical protein [Oscillibacter sp.]